MSKRPLLLDMLPRRLRGLAYYQLYQRRASQYPGLFDAAELAYARGTTLRLRPGHVAHAEIAFTGVYEIGPTPRLIRLARGGGALCDVGANYGHCACLWTPTALLPAGTSPLRRTAARTARAPLRA